MRDTEAEEGVVEVRTELIVTIRYQRKVHSRLMVGTGLNLGLVNRFPNNGFLATRFKLSSSCLHVV
jgi:hypothetical protein